MRLLLALSLFGTMLALAGCSNPPKWFKGDSTRPQGGTNQPFVGSPTSDPTPTDQISADTLASKDGKQPGKAVLAGQVLDNAGRRVPAASIKITEVEPPKEAPAPLSVETDKFGWFTVAGLESGRAYRLQARVRDGNRELVGSARVQAPNVRVAIALTGEEPVGGHPDQEKQPKEDKKTSGPSAVLGSPVPSKPAPTPPPVPSAVEDEKAIPTPGIPLPDITDPSLIAKDKHKGKDGFQKDPVVDIPGPGREPQRKPVTPYSPPPPPLRDEHDLKPSLAPSAIPGPGATIDETPHKPSASIVPSRLVIPSCVRVGQRVENFALYDYDGKAWELKKQRRGKLVLLDFWFSACGPCKQAMPFLVDLDRKYRRFGLDIVGIAHEEGSLAEKQDTVRPIRARYGIHYPIVFTGGGTSPNCPVLKQCDVYQFPTLLLLDDSGKIVLRSTGLNDRAKYDLEMDVRRRLGLR